jgi:two-component system sensor histidine kinase DesK
MICEAATTQRDRLAGSELHAHESRLDFRRGRKILRWASLLYTAYFFIMPVYRHSWVVWLEFVVFYTLFVTLYFLATEVEGRTRQIVLVLFFLLGFLYYPLNPNAAGAFVYPIAMSAFFIRRLRYFFLVLALQMLGLSLETWILGLHMYIAQEVMFFSVVIGLSNFAYAQQTRANVLLEHANAEIEHLTQEAERARIARDLHDLLGHTLTVITVKLDLARRLLPRDVERAQSEIIEAEQTARKALAEVREAVTGYRSEGLTLEISRARQTLLSANVQLTTSIDPVAMAAVQAGVLCLALREAVTNIVRYAGATCCHIELFTKDSQLCFTIADDGLRGMRERLHAIAGTLKVLGNEPRGTRLLLEVPLANVESLHAASFTENERV